MSGSKRHNEELEDKYAHKAVSFKPEPIQHTTDSLQSLKGMQSDVQKQKA